MERKETKPLFIDFLFLEDMLEVARLDDVRLRGYPQAPQLKETSSAWDIAERSN